MEVSRWNICSRFSATAPLSAQEGLASTARPLTDFQTEVINLINEVFPIRIFTNSSKNPFPPLSHLQTPTSLTNLAGPRNPPKNLFSATSPFLPHLDPRSALFQNSPFRHSSRYIMHTLSNRVRRPGHIKLTSKSYYQGLKSAKMPNNKDTSKGNSQQDIVILCLLSHLLTCLKGCRS